MVKFGKANKLPIRRPDKSQQKTQKSLPFSGIASAGIAGLVAFLILLSIWFLSSGVLANYLVDINIQSTFASPISSGWKTGLIVGHLIGLMLGFGVAVFLDLYLLRYLFHQKITPEAVETAVLGSKIVNFGLVLLWLSGLGFLYYYQLASPEKLSNPKIWAKLTIVFLLTVNGIAIHFIILKKLRTKIGNALLHKEPLSSRLGLLFSGAVSIVSWSTAMGLGAIKEINNVVEAYSLLAIYACVLALVFIVLITISNVIEKRNFQFRPPGPSRNLGATPGLLA